VATKQDDRIMHAAPYLALFAGFWFVGPLVIYMWQKDKSRTVAFQAMQAVVMCLVFIALFVVMIIANIGGSIALAQLAKDYVIHPSVMMLTVFLPFVAMLLPLVITVVGAWRAYHNPTYSMFLVGRITRSFIGDPSAPPGA
jgi:uncharacterized Tic20 family protein